MAAQIMNVLIPFFGLLTGLAIAIVLSMLWITFAGATQEWLTEVLLDRRHPAQPAAPSAAPSEILVSDLHIDTWEYPDARAGGRVENFLEFLRVVREDSDLQGFILNGDLMDIPLFAPHLSPMQNRLMLELTAGDLKEQGVLAPCYDDILKPLLTLEQMVQQAATAAGLRRSVFQTGNHDIGITGLRYVRPKMPDYLPGVQVSWNPQILLKGGPRPEADYRKWVYIEHGHHYDPFLWIYMRYAMLDILRGGHLEREAQMISAMQRRGRRGMGKTSRKPVPGIAALSSPNAANDGAAPDEVKERPAMPAPAPQEGVAWHFSQEKRGFGELIVQYRYRQAARRVFQQLRKSGRANIRTVIFGHTHIPDRYVFPDGYTYINSGDWCGDTGHQCYCVVHADGATLGPFQWESKDKAMFGADASTAQVEPAAVSQQSSR